jgi:hypothetical protein
MSLASTRLSYQYESTGYCQHMVGSLFSVCEEHVIAVASDSCAKVTAYIASLSLCTAFITGEVDLTWRWWRMDPCELLQVMMG